MLSAALGWVCQHANHMSTQVSSWGGSYSSKVDFLYNVESQQRGWKVPGDTGAGGDRLSCAWGRRRIHGGKDSTRRMAAPETAEGNMMWL